MNPVTSENPRASFAGNTTSSSTSSAAQSQFAEALGREAQSSSSAGQPMTVDPRMPTRAEQAAQQSLPSGRQTPASGGANGEQLYLSDQLTQRVRATRSGPGFDKNLNRDMTKASDAFGPGGKTDVLHPDDKPFALTQAGEESDVRGGPSAANRSAGATRDKAAVAEARSKGEFTRTDGVDLSAQKGVRGPQPAKSEWRGPMSEWEGSVPGRPQSSTAPTVEPPPMSTASPQLKLPNVCEATPSTPAAPPARAASTPPPPAEPTPAVGPQAAARGGAGPSALEGAVGRLSGPAAVVGGTLSTKTFANDLEMHNNPSSPRLGPVGTHRMDSQGTEWIKIAPDTWATKGYFDKML